jgi:hypothetical protein
MFVDEPRQDRQRAYGHRKMLITYMAIGVRMTAVCVSIVRSFRGEFSRGRPL